MNQKRLHTQRNGPWGLFGLVAAFSLAMTLGQFIATQCAAPDTSVRIAATLASRGVRDARPHIAAAMAASRLIDTMGYAPTLASR